jgi:hypothetical protein
MWSPEQIQYEMNYIVYEPESQHQHNRAEIQSTYRRDDLAKRFQQWVEDPIQESSNRIPGIHKITDNDVDDKQQGEYPE